MVLLLALYTLLIPGTPKDTLHVNLASAISYALTVSPEIKQLQQKVAYSHARIAEARAHRLVPEFELSTAHAPAPRLTPSSFPPEQLYLDPTLRNDWEHLTVFNQIQIKIGQPLYTWGEIHYSIQAATHGKAVDAADVAAKRLEVAHRTAQLYANTLLTQALLRLTRETGEIIDRAKKEIRRLLKEGDESVDDADLFQVLIVEQEYLAQVAEVEEQHQLAITALRRQLDLPDSTLLQIDTRFLAPLTFPEDSLQTFLNLGLQHRPELAKASAGFAARDAQVRVARSDYYPKLFLGISGRLAYTPGRYYQPHPYIRDELTGRSLQAGLGFRQKLNFGITRARVKQAEAQREEVHYQKEAARLLILYQVEEAYRKLRIAKAYLKHRKEALRISNEWLRTEEINFDLALGDTENLVRAVKANLDLQAKHYLAIHQYNLAVFNLLYAAGTLIEDIQSGRVTESIAR